MLQAAENSDNKTQTNQQFCSYMKKKNYNITLFNILILEIWGKAHRESAQHPKSDWGEFMRVN